MTQQPVSVTLIKELRDRTGVGMGKCKEALEESKGDIELAISNLRKAGMASAVKKEGRTTSEGVIAFAESPKAVAVVEVNAETDFVARNERFQDFVAHLSKEIANVLPASLEEFLKHSYQYDGHNMTVDEHRSSLIQTIGENIQIKRLQIFPKSNDKSIGVYSHLGGKIVTIVEISGSNGEEALAKDIAMHIAAAAPDFVSPEAVPADVLANEREIAQSQIKGKPENIIEKIVEGKLEAFFGTVCLTRQKYIKNDQLTIQELVDQRAKAIGKPLKIIGFARWGLNQG
jgi:elongation factor Ts